MQRCHLITHNHPLLIAILEEKFVGGVVEWVDLKRLDTLIQQTKALGACVEVIGVSGEG